MNSWINRGEGFLNTFPKQISKRRPCGKKRFQKKTASVGNQKVKHTAKSASSSTNLARQVPKSGRCLWKDEEFMAEFQIQTEKTLKENVDIDWQSASSSENEESSLNKIKPPRVRTSSLKRKHRQTDHKIVRKGKKFKSSTQLAPISEDSFVDEFCISDSDSCASLAEIKDVESNEECGGDRNDTESEGRDEEIQTNQSLNIETPCISSGSSVAESSNDTKDCRVSFTDFISLMSKQKTPTKNSIDEEKNFDSGKKKKKFEKGSITDQINRIIKRQKTSIRFWYHSFKANSDQSNKHLVVEILTMVPQYSVYCSNCRVLSNTATQSDKHRNYTVLFSSSTVSQIGLKVGMTVKIFPPWQQLDKADGNRIILCSYYIEVMSDTRNEPPKKTESTTKFTWSCPCSINLKMLTTSCPAHTKPVDPDLFFTQSDLSPTIDVQGNQATTRLNSVSRLSQQVTVTRTLLESMERVGKLDVPLPSFTASVLRVFRQPKSSSTKFGICELLMEDEAGSLALVKMPDSNLPSELLKLEMKTCVIGGFSVVDRISKERHSLLFGLIQRVWQKKFLSSSSQESNNSQLLMALSKPPSYCYVLESLSSEYSVKFCHVSDKEHQLVNLLPLADLGENGVRVSFVGKVFVTPSQRESGRTLNVFDESIINHRQIHRVLNLSSKCFVPSLIENFDVVLFRDVLQKDGELICDELSLVLTEDEWSDYSINNILHNPAMDSLKNLTLALPYWSPQTDIHDLITFSGLIVSIDEDKAFSWDECDRCANDDLITTASDSLFCSKCSSPVVCPVTKMKLEVKVKCEKYNNYDFTLDLSQRTISQLLPMSEADEEGHDIEAVLGKFISVQACQVISLTPPQHGAPQTCFLSEL